jgi:hypothetical protein
LALMVSSAARPRICSRPSTRSPSRHSSASTGARRERCSARRPPPAR